MRYVEEETDRIVILGPHDTGMTRITWMDLQNKRQRTSKVLVLVGGAAIVVADFLKVVALDGELVAWAVAHPPPAPRPHDDAEIITRDGAVAVIPSAARFEK